MLKVGKGVDLKAIYSGPEVSSWKIPVHKSKNPPSLDLHHTVERGRQARRQNLMMARSGCQSVRNVPRAGKKAFGSSGRWGVITNGMG